MVYKCSDCGVLVEDQLLHNQFHRALNESEKAIIEVVDNRFDELKEEIEEDITELEDKFKAIKEAIE